MTVMMIDLHADDVVNTLMRHVGYVETLVPANEGKLNQLISRVPDEIPILVQGNLTPEGAVDLKQHQFKQSLGRITIHAMLAAMALPAIIKAKHKAAQQGYLMHVDYFLEPIKLWQTPTLMRLMGAENINPLMDETCGGNFYVKDLELIFSPFELVDNMDREYEKSRVKLAKSLPDEAVPEPAGE